MAMTQAQLERQREYRLRTGNAVQKKYYQANKAKIYQASKDWRAANPEKVKIIRKKALKNSKQRRQSSIAAFAEHAFSTIKSRAKKHGRGLKITANYLETLLRNANGVCQVSGLPITYKIGDVHIASFDRIDNNKGYVYGNIQVVSSYVNYAKQEFSQEMLFEVAKGIVAHHNL